jgi:lysophospholipase L1-like esterase
MQSDQPTEFAEVRTTVDAPLGRRFDRLEVWPRLQRGGGDLIVSVDGAERTVPTAEGAPAVATWQLADRPHQVRIRPAGNGMAGLYGVVVERSHGGVVLDQLGIPGMRAEIHLHWREDRWVEQAARRKPDLVVLAYGTNDLVGEVMESIEAYERGWRQVIARVRKAAPEASCILVGPTDRLVKDASGKKVTAPRTAAIVEAQRRVAAATGCAHWDARAAMGGDGAMARWQAAGWATRDDVHLTRKGYTKLAELFDTALHGPAAR